MIIMRINYKDGGGENVGDFFDKYVYVITTVAVASDGGDGGDDGDGG